MRAELAPLSLERLLDWILRERAALGTIFGLHEDLFRCDLAGRPFALQRRGRRLENPLGVAAGPHSQLAQNLVAAWLCGARYLELKTIQARDDLDIPRPCIDMADEGYNCEWSQELPLDVSCDQYLDAWTAISVIRHRAQAGAAGDDCGFALDLSVGYDLAGIRSDKMQRCLDRLTVPGDELARRLHAARTLYPRALDIAPADRLCDSVTLSTMHGCPPEEIERIGRFLICERGLHTSIKLNPTLLGAAAVRELLATTLGYAIEVPDAAFAHDLAWNAALDLIRSLRDEAARQGLGFGVKLTNTLACRNTRGVLPAAETLVYLSGRALHPVAARLAAELQTACGGLLDVSFAGGLAAGNFARVIACGLGPATVCSDLLRPGGYQRLRQYLERLETAMTAARAADCDTYILRSAGSTALPTPASVAAAALANLRSYAAAAAADPAYHKAAFGDRCIKTPRALGRFDCIGAPCQDTCPAGQDVPAYMAHTARGDFAAALAVVLGDNPFPTVTGMVCDHPCQMRCTRVNYEASVRIRDVKRTLAHQGGEPPLPQPVAPTRFSAAVIGAGPAGLACAWYLTLAGVRAPVYEAKGFAGGMMADAIPRFRLRDEDVQRDLRRLAAAGVEIMTDQRIDREGLLALRRQHDFVFVGIGAQADRALDIPGEDLAGVWPALRFLSAARRGAAPARGAAVAEVGGGHTAQDAARPPPRRVAGGGPVHLVYRRTLAEMPAAREELLAVQAEGVIIHELLAPAAIEPAPGGRLALVCRRMRLGAPDTSGRPRPEPVPGDDRTLIVDTIVPAVGQALAGDLLTTADLPADHALNRLPAQETALAGVLVGGDALRGPATLIEAIADGRRAAAQILAALGVPADSAAQTRQSLFPSWRRRPTAIWQDRAARLQEPILPPTRPVSGPGDCELAIGELTRDQARTEAARCLDCAVRCDVCVSVCPNRANLAYEVLRRRWPLVRLVAGAGAMNAELLPDGEFVLDQTRQTANLVDFCNECGNCQTFCPTAGAPFRDKPRLVLRAAAAAPRDGDVYRLTRSGTTATIQRLPAAPREADRCGEPGQNGPPARLSRHGETYVYETAQVRLELDAADFAVRRATCLEPGPWQLDLREAAAMAVLLDGLAEHPIVGPIAKE